MVEVTQEDRAAAAGYGRAVCIFTRLECREIIAGRNDDCTVIQAFARHRIAAEQRGKIEGARLAIEAVLPEVVTDRTIDAHGAHCRCTTCELNIAEDGIRALSPAKIVGEG